jgi:hypothetical protein
MRKIVECVNHLFFLIKHLNFFSGAAAAERYLACAAKRSASDWISAHAGGLSFSGARGASILVASSSLLAQRRDEINHQGESCSAPRLARTNQNCSFTGQAHARDDDTT